MIKRILSSFVALAMVASIGFVSQVSAKQVTTSLIGGVPVAGQTVKTDGDFKIEMARQGASQVVSDGSEVVFTGGVDYDVEVAKNNCGNNYLRSYVTGNVTPETMSGSVYYEWTVNFSAAPAFIGVYNKDAEGAWGVYPGKLNYSVLSGDGKAENHIWRTGGIIPTNTDVKVGFRYSVDDGTWTLVLDDKDTTTTGKVKDVNKGIGQCWLEVSMVGATDTMTIKNIAVNNTVVEKPQNAIFSGLPQNGLTKDEGDVKLTTAKGGTANITNDLGVFTLSGDCSNSTANFTRVMLNTTAKTTGYLWYEYTVNMSEVPSIIAINARQSGYGAWQYTQNLNYSKASNQNNILRTDNSVIVPGQDYTFGFLVDLDSKTYTITQDGLATNLSGSLANPTADVGMVWFETQMNSATGTVTMKDACVRYFEPDDDSDALYEGIPTFGTSKTMNGISLSTAATTSKGASIVNTFKTLQAKAVHVADNSNYVRVSLNGIVNDSDRSKGIYLVEFTLKANAAPRDLGFFSRANGNYPLRVHIMNANSDTDYATMLTTGEQFVPNKEYKFGLLYDTRNGNYVVSQDGAATDVAGTVATMDGDVRTMSDCFLEIQTAAADDAVEITAIKVTALEIEPEAVLTDSGYGYSSKDELNSTYYTVQFNNGIENGSATLVLGADTTKPLVMNNIPEISAVTKLTWLVMGLTTLSNVDSVADGANELVLE